MKAIGLRALALGLLLLGPVSARADLFVLGIPKGTEEYKMYNDLANKDVSTFTGWIGTNNPGPKTPFATVDTIGNVDTGSGYANIKPVKDGTLSSLTLTPNDGKQWGDFSFRGQLVAAGDFTVEVFATQGGSTLFSFHQQKDQDFEDIGIIASDLTTTSILKVVITAATGSSFKEVKQINWSLANLPNGPPIPPNVPEPSSMAIAGLGALGLIGYGLRRRSK